MIFVGSYPFSWYTLKILLKNKLIPKIIITIKGDNKGDFIFYKNCLRCSDLKNTRIILIKDKSDFMKLELETSQFLVTSAFPILIPNKILSKAKCLALNVHPSLLPRWRGPDPIRNAIISGDKYIGVSIHKMTDFFDKGEIIAQKKLKNDGHTNLSEYIKLLAEAGAQLILNVINNPKIISNINDSNYESLYISEPYAHNLKNKLSLIKEKMPKEYFRITR
tara:strand:+ start:598 stop:1260 length:663 start_codon:yes stop_codon:yes gene_type:complete